MGAEDSENPEDIYFAGGNEGLATHILPPLQMRMEWLRFQRLGQANTT